MDFTRAARLRLTIDWRPYHEKNCRGIHYLVASIVGFLACCIGQSCAYHNHHPHYQPQPPSITTYTITLAETQYADVVHSNGFACRYYGPWTVGDIIQYNIVTLNPIVLGPTQYADFVFAYGASQRFHGPGVFNLVIQYTIYEDEE